LYLKAVDGGLLAPSKRVDQAWHLHIESDNDAWEHFCKEILLGQQLEHMTGLSIGAVQSAYSRTLDLYRREFDEEPAPDIWPGDAEKRRAAIGRRLVLGGLVMFFLGLIMGTTGITKTGGFTIAVAGCCLILAGAYIARGTDLEGESGCG
jgi:hypothetical protein